MLFAKIVVKHSKKLLILTLFYGFFVKLGIFISIVIDFNILSLPVKCVKQKYKEYNVILCYSIKLIYNKIIFDKTKYFFCNFTLLTAKKYAKNKQISNLAFYLLILCILKLQTLCFYLLLLAINKIIGLHHFCKVICCFVCKNLQICAKLYKR